MDTDEGQQLVQVAVPPRFLDHVARLLVQLEADDKSSRLPPSPRPAHPPELAGDWPISELERLIRMDAKSRSTILLVLDLLARHPEKQMTANAICDATALPIHLLKGALAGLRRLARAHFEYEKLGLPLNRHRARLPNGEPETVYWLTGHQARQWVLARTVVGGRRSDDDN